MSADDIKELFPDRIWAGFSPDYDGVVIVFSPCSSEETRVILPPDLCLQLGEELIARAKARLEPQAKIKPHLRRAERARRLDS
jgi:hypothetical protein